MVLAERYLANTDRLFQFHCCFAGPAQAEQRQTDRLPDRGFQTGFSGEARSDALPCPQHHLRHGDVPGEPSRRFDHRAPLAFEPRMLLKLRRIDRSQHLVEELVDRLGGGRLAPRLEESRRTHIDHPFGAKCYAG